MSINTDMQKSNINLLYVGAVSVTEILMQFIKLDDDLGNKIVVGDGPHIEMLTKAYPNVTFDTYENLEYHLSNADVFIPSPQTSSLIMAVANMEGTPIAAQPSEKVNNFVVDYLNGVINENLETAIINATTLSRSSVKAYFEEYYMI